VPSLNLPARLHKASIKLHFFLSCIDIIVHSALADKLAKLKKHVETYASLIMEELDKPLWSVLH
jgi:hypothetical protein